MKGMPPRKVTIYVRYIRGRKWLVKSSQSFLSCGSTSLGLGLEFWRCASSLIITHLGGKISTSHRPEMDDQSDGWKTCWLISSNMTRIPIHMFEFNLEDVEASPPSDGWGCHVHRVACCESAFRSNYKNVTSSVMFRFTNYCYPLHTTCTIWASVLYDSLVLHITLGRKETSLARESLQRGERGNKTQTAMGAYTLL